MRTKNIKILKGLKLFCNMYIFLIFYERERAKMKSFIMYSIGVMTGIILGVFVVALTAGYEEPEQRKGNDILDGLKMLKQKGNCITANNLEIFQTLTDGVALAYPVGDFDSTVLLLDMDRLFYDGEKVKNPSGECAKQVGTYSYETKAKNWRTIPAVIIEKK